MYKILPIIIVILFLSSCSESPKKEKVEIKLDSLIYDNDGNPLTGIMKGNFRERSIEFEVVNGRKHGAFRTYYESGKLEMEGRIKENKNDGLWKYYYYNGNVESEGNFTDDLVDGKWVWYYPSGKLREISEYKMGMRDGKLTMYDEDGKVISESMFENGIEVKSD